MLRILTHDRAIQNFYVAFKVIKTRGFSMESVFRGYVGKEVDSMVTPEAIDKIIVYSKNFPLHKVEDFCFGVIVGFILTATVAGAKMLYGRDATDKEMMEAMNMVNRRAMEIKGAIKLAMGK